MVCYLHWAVASSKVNSLVRVVIKTAPLDNGAARESLEREYNAYRISSITSNPYFRAIYDIISDLKNLNEDAGDSPPYLVLEWMDCTLA